MNESLPERFRSELLPGERILWTGQPDPNVVFDRGDFLLVPFSLLWGGFAIFWEASAIAQHGGPFFAIWGIPFVGVGLHFIGGRFVYKRWKKRRTFYAVTDRRAMVLSEGTRRTVEAVFLKDVPTINRSTRPSGIGSVAFGNSSGWASMFSNSGMGKAAWPYGSVAALTFYDIADADRVYDLVMRLRATSAER